MIYTFLMTDHAGFSANDDGLLREKGIANLRVSS